MAMDWSKYINPKVNVIEQLVFELTFMLQSIILAITIWVFPQNKEKRMKQLKRKKAEIKSKITKNKKKVKEQVRERERDYKTDAKIRRKNGKKKKRQLRE